MKNKISKLGMLLFGIIVVSFASVILIPEIGEYALLNELFSIIGMIAVIVMLVKAIVSLIQSKEIIRLLATVMVTIVIGLVMCSESINTIKDVSSGPEWITISNCKLEKRNTSSGIYSLRYYLKGNDSKGNTYRFRISGNEYDILNGKDELSVLCYKNTGRIVEIKK